MSPTRVVLFNVAITSPRLKPMNLITQKTFNETTNSITRMQLAGLVHCFVRHFILHYLAIFNSKSSSIDTNFDAELIKDVAVS